MRIAVTFALAACSLLPVRAQTMDGQPMMDGTKPPPAAPQPSPASRPPGTPSQQPPPPPPGGDGQRPGREAMRKFLDSLPDDIRKRFESAREKALQDPKIQELRQKADQVNHDFMEAMRAKMQEIDPGLADIIKDHGPRKDGPRPGGDDHRGGGGGPDGGGMAKLTDAERAQLMAARAKAKDDPAVVAAEKKKDAATTPEDRRAASEEMRKAMRDAMVKADPTIEPVLKKLFPAAQPPPPPPQGGGDQMMNGAPPQ